MTRPGFCIFCHNYLGSKTDFVTYRHKDICYLCLGEILKVAQLSKAMVVDRQIDSRPTTDEHEVHSDYPPLATLIDERYPSEFSERRPSGAKWVDAD